MSQNQNPFNTLPPAVAALAIVMLAIEVVLSLASNGIFGAQGIGWRISALNNFAVSGQMGAWMLENGIYPASVLIRFVTYPFLHGDFMQGLFGAAMILALGKFVGEAIGMIPVLIISVLASIIGAVAFILFMGGAGWLYGAFPAVYGLIGGYTYIMWVSAAARGEQQLMAFRLIGFLMGFQLLFGLIFGNDGSWIADFAGFAAGFAVTPLLIPGGVRMLVEKIRRR